MNYATNNTIIVNMPRFLNWKPHANKPLPLFIVNL